MKVEVTFGDFKLFLVYLYYSFPLFLPAFPVFSLVSGKHFSFQDVKKAGWGDEGSLCLYHFQVPWKEID